MLRMDIDKTGGHKREREKSHRTVVYIDLRSSGSRDFPTYYHLITIPSVGIGIYPFYAPLVEYRTQFRIDIHKYSLHFRLPAAVTDHAGIRAASEQERQSSEHYRLSGAGLPGDYGQSGTELKLEPVDQRIIRYS